MDWPTIGDADDTLIAVLPALIRMDSSSRAGVNDRENFGYRMGIYKYNSLNLL